MELQPLRLYEGVDPRKGHQVVERLDDRGLFKMRQIVDWRSIIAIEGGNGLPKLHDTEIALLGSSKLSAPADRDHIVG